MNTDLDLVIDEHWLNFECDASMLTLVSPDDICPVTVPQIQSQPILQNAKQMQQEPQLYQIEQEPIRVEQQFHYQVNQQQSHSQQKFHQEYRFESQQQEHSMANNKYQLMYDPSLEQHITTSEIKHQLECRAQSNHNAQDTFNQIINVSETQSIGPPPLLVPRQEKVYSIQQQLDYRKALARQRCEKLKARLDGEPPRYPPRVMKKHSGKKMTGRERLNELERQERALLEQRDHLKETIAQYEAKCMKLRQLLGNIVANSPEYNNEMINCLKADGLLIDSHIN